MHYHTPSKNIWGGCIPPDMYDLVMCSSPLIIVVNSKHIFIEKVSNSVDKQLQLELEVAYSR